MRMKVRKPYETPALTVVEVRIEQGYGASDKSLGLESSGTYGDDNIEAREDGGDLDGGNWF